MQLALDSISKKVGAQTWLYDMSLSLQPNAVTVLLGATQAGKTSLMRIMAGLDTPTSGTVKVDGVDVTGMPVRDRNVAMVYQQFINYPSMKVAAEHRLAPEAARRKAGHRQAGCGRSPAACTSTCSWSATRPSCRAGSSSAWRWRVRWPRVRR